jgi:hypothetical protein
MRHAGSFALRAVEKEEEHVRDMRIDRQVKELSVLAIVDAQS